MYQKNGKSKNVNFLKIFLVFEMMHNFLVTLKTIRLRKRHEDLLLFHNLSSLYVLNVPRHRKTFNLMLLLTW